jgi:hypothetical protein
MERADSEISLSVVEQEQENQHLIQSIEEIKYVFSDMPGVTMADTL